MDRLDGMRAFAQVVDSGGFTPAAAELGLSRAAVSKLVLKLEEALGVRLLNRTTRRVSTTEVGAAYYERCRQILSDVEEAELAAAQLNAAPRGTLRVNAPMTFGIRHLAPALGEFMARYPALDVNLVLNDRVVDIVDEGFDLAVRIGGLAESSLIARRLTTSRSVLCASPDYLRINGIPLHPGDLVRHRCLHYGYQATGNQWHLIGPDGEHRVRIAGPLSVNNGDVLVDAGRRGLGVVLLPTFIVGQDLASGALQEIMPGYAPPVVPVSILYPPNRHLAAKVRAFIDFMAARFGPKPYWETSAG